MSWKWGRGERGIVWRRLMVLSFPRAASLQLLLLAAPSPQKTISLKDFTSETSILSRPLLPFICAVWPILEHYWLSWWLLEDTFQNIKFANSRQLTDTCFMASPISSLIPPQHANFCSTSVESVYHEADVIGLAVHLRISVISSKLFSIACKRRLLKKKWGSKKSVLSLTPFTLLNTTAFWLIFPKKARMILV